MKAKQQFLKNDALAKEWADIVASPVFRSAVDSALLEMIQQQPIAGSINDQWDRQANLIGARLFCDILTNLPLPDAVRESTVFPNLRSPR